MSRAAEHHTAILVLGLVLVAAVFVVLGRTRPAIVTDEEVRLPRRTIRRADVARVTRSLETTAFIFHAAEGGVVGVADLHERSGEFRDALRAHGWPRSSRPPDGSIDREVFSFARNGRAVSGVVPCAKT